MGQARPLAPDAADQAAVFWKDHRRMTMNVTRRRHMVFGGIFRDGRLVNMF